MRAGRNTAKGHAVSVKLDKEFQYHYRKDRANKNVYQAYGSLSRMCAGGIKMDVQLVIVGVIVLAAVAYMVWRAKKARKGQCSCGCSGCGKSCKPKAL